MNHLIDLCDFPDKFVIEILTLARKIYENPVAYSKHCFGKVMATLFFEPSTRTQMSFQTAMYRLGGNVIGFSDPLKSSVAKGECLRDTIQIVSGYSDIVVMRHSKSGSARAGSLYSSCPLINAGDGSHLHPTQTLTDLMTLQMEHGELHNLTIGLCGDLKYGRTVHSLIKSLCSGVGNRFVLISSKEMMLPNYVLSILKASNCEYKISHNLKDSIPELDVLYMTRIQLERMGESKYIMHPDTDYLDSDKLKYAKPTLKILHPLPRVDEIDYAVDDDPRVLYFKQAIYGMYVRMALIIKLLEIERPPHSKKIRESIHKCENPNCITNSEPYLPSLFTNSADMITCRYCDKMRLV